MSPLGAGCRVETTVDERLEPVDEPLRVQMRMEGRPVLRILALGPVFARPERRIVGSGGMAGRT